MGAGILPTCIYKNKLYFLFGKEHDYCDTPGWSDFGGGTDAGETYMQTAIREGGEELTGFLGSDAELSSMLKKHGTFTIDNKSGNHGNYRMHIFPLEYDPALPHYYNNNQRFLQSHLDVSIIKKTKIFEKAEIRWICINDILRMKKQFRSYFQEIVQKIHEKRHEILVFMKKAQTQAQPRKKNKTNKTRKYRS